MPSYTRVAVVQLAYLPAILLSGRSLLEDPLGEEHSDSLLPTSKLVPESLQEELGSLRRRIRDAYDAQLLAKVRAVLAACRDWGVRLAVFPEYSLSWELLEEVAREAGDMALVAGSHTVERAARRSGLYHTAALDALA